MDSMMLESGSYLCYILYSGIFWSMFQQSNGLSCDDVHLFILKDVVAWGKYNLVWPALNTTKEW